MESNPKPDRIERSILGSVAGFMTGRGASQPERAPVIEYLTRAMALATAEEAAAIFRSKYVMQYHNGPGTSPVILNHWVIPVLKHIYHIWEAMAVRHHSLDFPEQAHSAHDHWQTFLESSAAWSRAIASGIERAAARTPRAVDIAEEAEVARLAIVLDTAKARATKERRKLMKRYAIRQGELPDPYADRTSEPTS